MGHHSIAETKNKLSELIGRAQEGEEVVVTRHGRPVARIAAVAPERRCVTPEDIAWLKKHRIYPKKPVVDAGELVSRMRDEEWVERLLRR